MKWVISKDGVPYCTTTVPYPKETIKAMKAAGYKVKEVKDDVPKNSAVPSLSNHNNH